MKRATWIGTATALMLGSMRVAVAGQTDGWRTYRGAWFQIRYPPGFTARGSLHSSTAEGYDSAFFRSPDGDVEFYVFSPQWSGEPSDILIKRDSEVCISWSCEERKGHPYDKKLIYVELRAKDGSYDRAYVDIREGESIRYAFGIKYTSRAAYDRFRSRYLAFKASLTQYAD